MFGGGGGGGGNDQWEASLYALHVGVVLDFFLGRRLDSADINRPWVYPVHEALCVASRWRSRTLSRWDPKHQETECAARQARNSPVLVYWGKQGARGIDEGRRS